VFYDFVTVNFYETSKDKHAYVQKTYLT